MNTSRSARKVSLSIVIGIALAGCSSDSSREERIGIVKNELTTTTLYDNGAITAGWNDISSTQHTVNSTAVLFNGLHTLSVKFTAYGWIAFENNQGLSGNDALSFYVYGGTNVAPKLSAEIEYNQTWSSAIGYAIPSISAYCDGNKIPTNAWTHCQIPLSAFGATPSTVVQGISIDATGKALKAMAFSTIQLVSTTPQGSGGTAGTGGSSPSGGSVSSGGSIVAGGTTSAGGSPEGGSPPTGGSISSGGSSPSGGSVSSGGSIVAGGSSSTGGTAPVAYTIYDNGALSQGWADSSSSTHTLDSTAILFNDLHTASVNLSGYSWLSFESTGIAGNDYVSFYVYGGSNTAPRISSEIKYNDTWSSTIGISVSSIDTYCEGNVIPTNAWTHCQIPLSAFGATLSTVLQGISFDGTGATLDTIAFATVQLIASTPPQGSGGATGAGGAINTGGTTSASGAAGTNTSTGTPLTGVHAMKAIRISTGETIVTAPAIDTQASNSTFVVSVGRGYAESLAYLPTDNKGNNPFVQFGSSNRYVGYPDSGAALYTFTNGIGGIGHIFQVQKDPGDETTIAVVEVKNGHTLQDAKGAYVSRTSGNTIISPSVTTTGPATIVAFCWGDYPSTTVITAVNNQFQVLDQYAASDGISVQSASASRDVTEPGTYNVTWTIAQPITGAIVYIAAIQ